MAENEMPGLMHIRLVSHPSCINYIPIDAHLFFLFQLPHSPSVGSELYKIGKLSTFLSPNIFSSVEMLENIYQLVVFNTFTTSINLFTQK